VKGDRAVEEKVRDLVCDMMIDPKTAAATSEYKGQTYYFCARGCKVAFDKDPEKYIKKAQAEAEH
jgi:Cu+-exporting ATPase